MNGIEKAVVTAVGRILAEHEKRIDDKIAAFDGLVAEAFGRIDARLTTLKDGEPGKDGAPGESIKGEKGDKGDPGDRGPPGQFVIGDPGPPGEPGKDGAPGKDGESIKGDKGDPGDRGEKGDPGVDGKDGESIKGDQGEPGAKGDPGEPGKDGISIKGDPGDPGEPGPKGDRGEPGKDGLPGVDGAAWEPQGTHDAARAYHRLDVVAKDGGSFIALRNSPGAIPGPDWQQIAVRGKPGKPGDKGDRGDRGERGKDGAAGVGIADIVTKEGRVFVMLTDGRNLSFELAVPA